MSPVAIRAADELAQARVEVGTVLTIGTFDGVHCGHRDLVGHVVERARALGLTSAVISFRVPPRNVLVPDSPVPCLTTLPERLELLKVLGPDLVMPLTFDRELSLLTAREFMELLRRYPKAQHLIVGPDFALGHRREGTVPILRSLGEEMGFSVEVIDDYRQQGERVSSSAIRRELAEGDIESVQRHLGHPYVLWGPVVEGHARGKGMGFPTANVTVAPEKALPLDGVYITRAHLHGTVYPSVTNIGFNPTFSDPERAVEVHILDFDEEIYGHVLGVEIVQRLRGEERFGNTEELVAQIERDVERARAVLSRETGQPPTIG